jgi:WD40 repeat protein
MITKLEGHSDNVWSAVFSPDGQRVVTASDDGTARVWNAATGQVIAKMEGHSGDSLDSAAFSPDGQRIVTASDDYTALIFRIVTVDEIARLLASK